MLPPPPPIDVRKTCLLPRGEREKVSERERPLGQDSVTPPPTPTHTHTQQREGRRLKSEAELEELCGERIGRGL